MMHFRPVRRLIAALEAGDELVLKLAGKIHKSCGDSPHAHYKIAIAVRIELSLFKDGNVHDICLMLHTAALEVGKDETAQKLGALVVLKDRGVVVYHKTEVPIYKAVIDIKCRVHYSGGTVLRAAAFWGKGDRDGVAAAASVRGRHKALARDHRVRLMYPAKYFGTRCGAKLLENAKRVLQDILCDKIHVRVVVAPFGTVVKQAP